VGWAVLPAPALWYTGRESPDTAQTVNRVAAALSLAGLGAYLAAVAVGTAPSASGRPSASSTPRLGTEPSAAGRDTARRGCATA